MSFLEPNRSRTRLNSESNDLTPLVRSSSMRNTYLAAASAFLYIVVMGMVGSYSAPATADMKRPGSSFKDVTPDQITWIASLPMFSGVVGNCFSGYISHRFGRKTVLMFLSAFYVFSWLLTAYAPTVPVIYVGRSISGFCAGISSVAVSAYVVEIAPTEMRGRLAAGFQVAFTVGVFAVMSTGIFLRWSWLAIFGGSTATLATCMMAAMPESPPWLIRNSRHDEFGRAKLFLQGKRSTIKKELRDLSDHQEDSSHESVSLRDVLDPALYKPLGIAVSLMFFQQACGHSALLSYTVEIFRSTGSSVDPRIAATVVAAVQVVATTISGMLMDKAGRKKLLVTSGTGAGFSLLILGTYSYISSNQQINLHLYGWIPLVSLVGFIVFFSVGLGPVPFVVAPEIVLIRHRSAVLAAASVTASFFAFLVTKVFEDMRAHLGLYGVYWTYSCFSFMSAIFGCLLLPETKGLSFKQIQRSFSNPDGK